MNNELHKCSSPAVSNLDTKIFKWQKLKPTKYACVWGEPPNCLKFSLQKRTLYATQGKV
jgi:hypothetical protein